MPIDVLYVDPSGPRAAEFTMWGPVTNDLQVAITGPARGSLQATKYFAALRNASKYPMYLCGIPWATIFLVSSTGSTITPTTSPGRSVFSPMNDTLEMLPNEEWIDPYSMTPSTSYRTEPPDVAGARSELEVHVGGRHLSSCMRSTMALVESATLPIALEP